MIICVYMNGMGGKTKRSLLYLCILHIFAGTTSQGLLTESLISSELRDTERRLKNLAVYGRSHEIPINPLGSDDDDDDEL